MKRKVMRRGRYQRKAKRSRRAAAVHRSQRPLQRPRHKKRRLRSAQTVAGSMQDKQMKRHSPLSEPLVSAAVIRSSEEAGMHDGQLARDAQYQLLDLNSRLKSLKRSFSACYANAFSHIVSYEAILALGKAYQAGYSREAGPELALPSVVLIPATKRHAVIISAMNEQERISSVLQELERLVLDELIIIVNGSTDMTLQLAREASPASTIVHYPDAIGHDVGRSIGAKLARADVMLFTDSDLQVPAEDLGAFIWAVESGIDVALNDISPFMGTFDNQDTISHCKLWLNHTLGREDLDVNSLTAVPHALSRRTVDTIGVDALSVPPRAHTLALLHGLNVQRVHVVDVITHNRMRATNVGDHNPVAQLILGDHVEAIQEIWKWYGDRLHEPQRSRDQIALRRNGT
ncbi:glycosyltransferase [Paenibacillus sp. ACRRX]|uniref:glycosyltransferase family 2 protein n=1 Tax=unclassified Paenibacillus TaxID=185978 RepID=UPI001EF51298|nr:MULTISPECIES: glycosyltransferase [unclassified Paenibacillus]MCG7410066.1 glycosyltransferase [Paenibacillus sp. ACRRX]MDK8183640.1 glycosyltransferase [Paenibacillus sp. UMB4589-SE434]